MPCGDHPCANRVRMVECRPARSAFYEPNLTRATLRGADLSGADRRGAELTQTQLDEACGDTDTKLPEGLKPPKPCPYVP
jgi:uncharacterized protein YjbI with pentapeptide repeats